MVAAALGLLLLLASSAATADAAAPCSARVSVEPERAFIGQLVVWRAEILRRSDGGIVKYRFDYGAYIKGNAPGSNMLLQPGDTIVVPD